MALEGFEKDPDPDAGFDGCRVNGAEDDEDPAAVGCCPSVVSPAETVLPRFDAGGGDGD